MVATMAAGMGFLSNACLAVRWVEMSDHLWVDLKAACVLSVVQMAMMLSKMASTTAYQKVRLKIESQTYPTQDIQLDVPKKVLSEKCRFVVWVLLLFGR